MTLTVFTQIYTELGMKAVTEAFKQHPDPKRPGKHILDLLQISLTKNDFEFDSQTYLQNQKIRHGQKNAPVYAKLTDTHTHTHF